MTGRTRLTLCSAAAVMLVSFCLEPLVKPAGWILHAAFLTAAATGVGALGRRLRLPRLLIPAAQVAAVGCLLALGFARDAAVYGLVPGPASVSRLVQVLQGGVNDVGNYGTPAPATPGLRLILVGSVALVAVAVDTLAVTYRRAALAGLPLLALYSVGTGLDDRGPAWLWFLLAAGGYLAVLFAEGQDRMSRWGRVFHGAGSGSGGPLTGGGRRAGVAALAVALAVPFFLPDLDGGLIASRLGHGGGRGGGTITAINPVVSLQSDLNQPDNIEQLSYTTTSKNAGSMYIRVAVSDDFDGVEWRPSPQRVEDVPSPLPDPPGLSGAVERTEVTTRIAVGSHLRQEWLPMPYPASRVDVPGRWRFEPNSRTVVGDNGQKTLGLSYTVTSLDLDPTPEQLRAAAAPPADIAERDLALPADLPDVVRTTARQVTQDADTPYDRAVALQDWFSQSGGFSYNTEVRAGTGIDAITSFLRRKEGFCVHFSATMAAMARTLGIPARVAVGFTSGSPRSDGSWTVGSKDAHAWPELYFEGAGWIRFEPTPSRGTMPDYTRQQTPAAPGADDREPRTRPTARPSAGPSTTPGCTVQERRAGECGKPVTAVPKAAPQRSAWPTAAVLAGAAVGLLLLALLLVPMLWRTRLRRIRLRPVDGGGGSRGGPEGGSGPPELTEAQVIAAWQELVDSAWDLGIAPDGAETPRRTLERIAAAAPLEDGPREAAGRVALATERALYARSAQAPAGLGDDVRAASEGLRAAAGRWTRVRAVVLPPSSVRMVWRVAGRYAAVRDAVRDAWWSARRRAADAVGGLLRRGGRG
ncbi:transglutaminaseTgpA domain-containing protein [Streptomyces sp. NPDC001380]|uniref:transglutaminase family protein n=1 Tax=Streptomyces sp. NPDC001380 TaxID=3364566 RepID=UPI00368C57EA